MIHRYSEFVGIIILSIFIVGLVWSRYSWLPAMVCGWVMTSAAVVFQWPDISSNAGEILLRLNAARAFIVFVSLVVTVGMFPKRASDWMLENFKWIALLEAALCVWPGYGLFNANSMDATFIAMIYPTVAFRNRPVGGIDTVISSVVVCALMAVGLITQGMTGKIVILSSMGAYHLARKDWGKSVILISAVLVLGAIVLFIDTTMTAFSDSGRFDAWRAFAAWWSENVPLWTGSGSGSFSVLAPYLHKGEAGVFLWAHNEYLQIFLEQGVVGLILTLALAVVCLKRTFRTPWLFATNVGVLVSFMTQFPLRVFVSQLFILLLVRRSLEEPDVV